MLDIRGTIVEVLELGVLLGSQPVAPKPESVVIVVTVDDATVGILVDSVFDIIQAGPGDLMPVPSDDGDGLVWAIIHYEDRLVSIVDPSKLNP